MNHVEEPTQFALKGNNLNCVIQVKSIIFRIVHNRNFSTVISCKHMTSGPFARYRIAEFENQYTGTNITLYGGVLYGESKKLLSKAIRLGDKYTKRT